MASRDITNKSIHDKTKRVMPQTETDQQDSDQTQIEPPLSANSLSTFLSRSDRSTEHLRHNSVMRLQQTRGNASTSRLIQQLRSDSVQRDNNSAPAATSAPSAAPTSSDPAKDAALEKEFVAEVRRQVSFRFSASYTKYTNAAEKVKGEIKDKEAQPTLLQQLVEVAIGSLAPGYVNIVLNRFKDGLKGIASVAIDKALGNSEKAVQAYITADALADKYITLDSAGAKAGFKKLSGLLKPTAVSTAGAAPSASGDSTTTGGAPPTGAGSVKGAKGTLPVVVMIDQFKQNFSVYLQNLDGSLASLDRTALLGVWAAFDQNIVTEEFYIAQIRDLVKQHEELANAASDPSKEAFGGIDSRKIVLFEAWGVQRPAIIKYDIGSFMTRMPNWQFEKWVSPEMDSTARALAPGQTGGLEVVKAGEAYPKGSNLPVLGHIPNPNTEGVRIIEVDMWGKLRLCEANIDGDGQSGTFIRWIANDEESFARVKGSRQPGGIARFDPSKFKKGNIPRPEN